MSPPLEIEYEVTLEDVTSFALHHHRTSPELKQRRRLLRLGMSSLLVVTATVVGAVAKAPLLGMVGLVFALAFYWMFPRRYERGLRETVARMYAEGKNREVLGPTKLTLDDHAIIETAPNRVARTEWRMVEGLAETETHVFVYVTGSTALVVPRRDIDGETMERFIQTVRAHLPSEAAGATA